MATERTIEQWIEHYAALDVEKFGLFFRRIRNRYPQECLRGCIRHLARGRANGLAGRQMVLWLISGVDYVGALVDPLLTRFIGARQAANMLRDADPQFYTRLARFLQSPKTSLSVSAVLRVLDLIPSLGECGVLIPWLRSLAQHSDENVRLCSAKVLCEMRPTRARVERQLQSPEPRTRAHALEMLWQNTGADATMVFRLASEDSDHGVRAKALVGLYLNRDRSAVGQMMEMAAHRSPLARLAIVGAMAKTSDPRCQATLRMLAVDADPGVRNAAHQVVATFRASKDRPTAIAVAGGASGPSQERKVPEADWVPRFQLLS